jgi:hypothetical protein
MDAVDADKDLVPEAKQRKKQEIATQALAQLDQSASLQRARESVTRQVQRWGEKVAVIVKPAANEAEAVAAWRNQEACRQYER